MKVKILQRIKAAWRITTSVRPGSILGFNKPGYFRIARVKKISWWNPTTVLVDTITGIHQGGPLRFREDHELKLETAFEVLTEEDWQKAVQKWKTPSEP